MIGPILSGIARAKFDTAHYAMTWDGNSISDGQISDLVTQTASLAPISNQITISNFAVNGKSIQWLIDNLVSRGVHNSYVAGKKNFLMLWEGTNSIFNDGRTGLQAASDYVGYINAVKAVHPGWSIILGTCIPRGDFLGTYWTVTTGEAELQALNAYLRANYRSMGADALVEMRRSGGPFDFTDSSNGANFPQPFWQDRTHPGNGAGNGKSVLAGYTDDVFKRLPAR